ncbi:hypothetical protein SFMTTN_2041 [Sulfuriferula multivorans]|uniref:Major capsid protein n=1 Tax=Sulfuriferula multivorans TaxID=1559896 RepID=A0A401JF46_9PROT|nr:major capsid protein [Sulfuriferula multivorans]GBL46228.1 hypothetical protein SFMTTN_2041 [Sulfuriferula multivorans]
MPQMTPAQARVIDPILTTAAQGYKNSEMVGMNLFPSVAVGQRGGKILSFRKEDFRLYATGRVPGANTKRVQFGHDSGSYALESHSLEGMVPYELMEEAAAVPGINLGIGAVNKVQNIIALRLEKSQADLATTAANYAAANKITLAGTAQWSDFATGVSDPAADMETAKDAVRALIGKRPNTVVMGASVFAKLRNHPKVIDRIKYTGRDTATPELLAQMFGVARVVVGDAIYENDAGAMADVWGKSVVIAYTDIGGINDMGLPTFGYTYRLRGYPIVEQAYQDRNAKSWIYPVTDEVSPVIAGASAGYLISAAVA